MRLLLFLLALLFSSCKSDYSDIKKLSLESIFHGNASKIWIINKVMKKGVNFSASALKDKEVIIFFESGKILIQPLHSLGTYPIKSGILSLTDQNTRVSFSFQKEVWRFRVTKLSSKKIDLTALKNSAFNYNLELISYPENIH